MTTLTYGCINHKMHLKADGDVLTQCKWMPYGSDFTDSSPVDQKNGIIEMAISQISEYLEGKRRAFSIPLRMEGTEFQVKVWEELRKIPYGETVTYAELAQRIGRPKAYRAVANACGANPFPILIPCHRVVASGGRSGGYTGGLDIKQTLLAIEKQNTSPQRFISEKRHN